MILSPPSQQKSQKSLSNGYHHSHQIDLGKLDKLSNNRSKFILNKKKTPRFSTPRLLYLSPQYSQKNLTRQNSLTPKDRPLSNLKSLYGPTNSSGNIMQTFLPLNINCSLYVLQKCLSNSREFLKKYGSVALTLELIQIDLEGCVQLKYNALSLRKTANQSDIISFFMEQVKKLSNEKFSDFYLYFARSSSRLKINLKGIISLIRSYAKCMKIKIAHNLFENKENPVPNTTLPKKTKLFNYEYVQKKQPMYQRFSVQQLKANPEVSSTNIHKSSIFTIKNSNSDKLLIKKEKPTEIIPQFNISVNQPKNIENRNKISFTTKDSSSNLQNSANQGNVTKNDYEWGAVSFSVANNNLFTVPQESDTTQHPKKQFNLQAILKKCELEGVVSVESCLGQKSPRFRKRQIKKEADCNKELNEKAQKIIDSNRWKKNVQNLLEVAPALKQSLTLQKSENHAMKQLENTRKHRPSRLWLKQTLQSQINDSIRVD